MLPSLDPIPTFRGEVMATLLLTAALMLRFPGMLTGSGDTERLWITTGSCPLPQSSQEKPSACSTRKGRS